LKHFLIQDTYQLIYRRNARRRTVAFRLAVAKMRATHYDERQGN